MPLITFCNTLQIKSSKYLLPVQYPEIFGDYLQKWSIKMLKASKIPSAYLNSEVNQYGVFRFRRLKGNDIMRWWWCAAATALSDAHRTGSELKGRKLTTLLPRSYFLTFAPHMKSSFPVSASFGQSSSRDGTADITSTRKRPSRRSGWSRSRRGKNNIIAIQFLRRFIVLFRLVDFYIKDKQGIPPNS